MRIPSPPGSWPRWSALVLDGFVAVTAIGGGAALATGAEGTRFPVDWLRRTPWTSYLIPGLILACVVGGSAVGAWIAVVRRRPSAGAATSVAAVLLAGQILGEVILLAQPGPITPTEVFYLVVAAGMLLSGVLLHVGRQPQSST
ncbi:MAG: hypothetical protein QG622_74 [Actinomycetota bacterium]|nr:hypothetical protein [Actinomycetota bacterium]